jgi:hypothetical protein
MAFSSSIGSSVEGEKIRLQTRKWQTPPPIRCEITKKLQYRFRLGMRGEAEIGEAYIDPPTIVHFLTSFTFEGDRIEGSSVSGWAWKPLGRPNVTTCSGTHSGTVVQISGGSLAQVEAPPREHLDCAAIQDRNPEIVQVRRLTE